MVRSSRMEARLDQGQSNETMMHASPVVERTSAQRSELGRRSTVANRSGREILNQVLDLDKPFKLADDVFWVGFYDDQSGLSANPYMIVDGDEAVVINSGSRSDFPLVMMKIMQTGIVPSSIVALIYQNYDPRLCGSIPHMEGIIDRDNLKIISDEANHMFIRHYCDHAKMLGLGEIGFEFRFRSGRCLQFIKIPYAHSAGSFVTFDSRSGILFTGDLFSGYARKWDLLLELQSVCYQCRALQTEVCLGQISYCPVADVMEFHQNIMPSERALRFALEQISRVPFTMIAPQHGWVIRKAEDIILLCERLATLQAVGIDGAIGNRAFSELGDTSAVKERLHRE
jgi:flavorubredoxin